MRYKKSITFMLVIIMICMALYGCGGKEEVSPVSVAKETEAAVPEKKPEKKVDKPESVNEESSLKAIEYEDLSMILGEKTEFVSEFDYSIDNDCIYIDDGCIYAIKPGVSEVEVKDQDVIKTFKVNVETGPVSLAVGTRYEFEFNEHMPELYFISDNVDRVKITKKGRLKGESVGSTKVRAYIVESEDEVSDNMAGVVSGDSVSDGSVSDNYEAVTADVAPSDSESKNEETQAEQEKVKKEEDSATESDIKASSATEDSKEGEADKSSEGGKENDDDSEKKAEEMNNEEDKEEPTGGSENETKMKLPQKMTVGVITS